MSDNKGNILAQNSSNNNGQQSSGRDFGQILADAGIGALRSAASGRGILGVLAGGALGAIEGDTNEKMRNLQEEQQQLQNENVRSIIASREQANQRAGRELALAEAREQRADAGEQRAQEAHNSAMEAQALRQKQAALTLASLEKAFDDEQLKRLNTEFDQLMERSYSADLDFMGQSVLKNSSGYQEARDFYTILKIYDENPEMAQRFMQRLGWNVQETPETGNTVLVNSEGKVMPFNEESMAAVQRKVHEDFQNSYMAAMTLGTPASTLQQAAMRNILYAPSSKALFGEDAAGALGAYNDMIKKGNYSNREITTHIMSRTLNAALQDNQLTQEEMSVLIPQFSQMLGEFGGTITPGEDIEHTFINLRQPDGSMSAVSIGEFAKKLAMQDRILGDWKNFVDGTLRKNGETKVQGWDMPGSNTAAGNNNNAAFDPNASNLDPKQVTDHFINLGREVVKKWELGDNQDDARVMVAYGAAEQAARNALNNSGYNIDARNAFHNAFKLMGYKIKKSTRANGSYFIPYDDHALREADLERVNAEITNASVSGDSKRVAELKKKRAEIEAWGRLNVEIDTTPSRTERTMPKNGTPMNFNKPEWIPVNY